MSPTQRLFITSPREMEGLLAEELQGLGVREIKPARAGVYVEDSIEAAYRICLWSRIANRVLLPLAEFDAKTPDQLYAAVRQLDWSQHFSSSNTIAVDAHATASEMRHDRFIEQRIKDAIVDRFRDEEGQRPSVDLRQPDIRINGHIHRDRVTLSLDLSGDSLHMRGYRTEGGAAPLKENLAAAVLLRARWPELAASHEAFIDFMCGSGTLLIEAAGMACDIAPGLIRERFGFLAWKQHAPELWERLLEEARERRMRGLRQARTIVGCDNNRRAVLIAQQNVERAGLSGIIKVEYQDLNDFRRDLPKSGLVVLNPPYGKRLGKDSELEPLYSAIGELLRRKFRNWRATVLTDNPEMGKAIGIRAQKIHTLYNGAIRCSLLHFLVAEEHFFGDSRTPRSLPAEELSDGAVMLRNRITKNRKRLEPWARREGISCYRVYDADLPEYAIAVDLYTSERPYLLVQEYEAPATIERTKAQRRLREAVTVLQELYAVEEGQIFFKRRRRQRGSAQYERTGESERYHEVGEGALRLLVNFEDHLDTGLFLDHRPTRAMVQQQSKGRSFLNLFAYTGSMTVAAAVGGATRTTSVDLSSRYLEWARRNMERNGMSGRAHQFIQADCVKWLALPAEEQFDLIFLDPPTFSNSARMEHHFDVQEDHEMLVERTMARLAPEGLLYFSVNARKFTLSAEIAARFQVVDITAKTIPRDFERRPNVHRCWRITHAAAGAGRGARS